MGDVSQVKALMTRPRPLGLVKKEPVRFDQTVEHSPPLSEHKTRDKSENGINLLTRSRTDISARQDLKSMRDLQETLRQAALLNIVAAVGDKDCRGGSGIPVRIKGATLLKHSIPSAGTRLTFEKEASDLSNSGGQLVNSLSELHSSVALTSAPSTSAAMPNTALTQLLSQRARTISIPRPRTHGEQGSFIHQSLSDAKDQLTNMTNFRARAREEASGKVVQTETAVFDGASTSNSGQTTVSQYSPVDNHISSHANRHFQVSINSPPVFHSSIMDGSSFSQFRTPEKQDDTRDINSHNLNGTITPRTSKENQRAQTVHQMQAVKRHIPTSKKREIVKKLTELAKCEAIDINEPIDTHLHCEAPPMVIIAPRKDYPRHEMEQDCFHSIPAGHMANPPVSVLDPDESTRVPSNTRAQSETLDAITNYRQMKRLGNHSVADDIRIESINSAEGPNRFRPQYMDHQTDGGETMSVWPPNHLFPDAIVGKSFHQTESPDMLELRPVAASPTYNSRALGTDRRKIMASRRSYNTGLRDKLISPSPAVFEASYHRPKASAGQISLVGQSLPSLSITKAASPNSKPKKFSSDSTCNTAQAGMGRDESSRNRHDLSERRQANMTSWGSTSKQKSISSPILKTEILDHLQCVGIVDRRPSNHTSKKSTGRENTIAKMQETNRALDEDYMDEDLDKCSETSKSMRPEYRKSKLYSAFRASEENLANLAEASSLVSEALTTRSLLNQPPASLPDKKMSTAEEIQPTVTEPLYMGCSSKVSEGEIKRQFHYISQPSPENKPNNFRVFKALDQDVYFDFQHRKYRNTTNNTALNTGSNKPRIHFLKIQYSGQAKS